MKVKGRRRTEPKVLSFSFICVNISVNSESWAHDVPRHDVPKAPSIHISATHSIYELVESRHLRAYKQADSLHPPVPVGTG